MSLTDGISMGSRNLSSSFSFAKDILKSVTEKLDEFVDSALTTYEESTGKKLKHGDEGIHLAGGSDFCMDIKRHTPEMEMSPAIEVVATDRIEISEVSGTDVSFAMETVEQTPLPEVTIEDIAYEPIIEVPEEYVQQTEEVPVIEQEHIIEDVPVMVADDVIAEEVHVEEHEPVTIDEVVYEPVIVEEHVSEISCVEEGAVSNYDSFSEQTSFDEEHSLISIPDTRQEISTSSEVEAMPSFHHSFEYEVEIDDGVDYDDLYEDIAAECIVYDIMPRLVPEVFEEEYVPEYVISSIDEPVIESTKIEIPVKYVPDYVISTIEEPVKASTVVDVPVHVPEYVISSIDEPTTEITSIDVPEPVVEVPSFVDPVTTTATFRFAFASTAMPGKTGFSFRMGKRNKVDEFINGPEN